MLWFSIKRINKISQPVKIMHVCGSHEHTIMQYGLRSLLPKEVEDEEEITEEEDPSSDENIPTEEETVPEESPETNDEENGKNEEEKPEDKKISLKNKDIREKFVSACVKFDELLQADDFVLDAELRKTIRPLIDKLNHKHITVEDIVASVSNNLDLNYGIGTVDNIDHLANRRIASVGELMKNEFRKGVAKLKDKEAKNKFFSSRSDSEIGYTMMGNLGQIIISTIEIHQ